VQVPGRRWSETDSDFGRHWSNQAVIPSEVEGSRDEIFKLTLPNPSVRGDRSFRSLTLLGCRFGRPRCVEASDRMLRRRQPRFRRSRNHLSGRFEA
jgi:hypothetical protein